MCEKTYSGVSHANGVRLGRPGSVDIRLKSREQKIEAHLGKINKINTSSQYHVYQLGHGNLQNKSY